MSGIIQNFYNSVLEKSGNENYVMIKRLLTNWQSRSRIIDDFDEKYKNKDDFENKFDDFVNGQEEILTKKIQEAEAERCKKEQEERERQKTQLSDEREKEYQERIKTAHENGFPTEIDNNVITKFGNIHIRIGLNRKTVNDRYGVFKPFERYWLFDDDGYNGKLRRAKDRLKSSFNAKYSTKFAEGGMGKPFWSVPSTTNLDELYDTIA